MFQTRFKWKCIVFSFIIIFNVFTKSLPASKQMYSFSNTNNIFDVTNSKIKAGNKNVTTVEMPVDANRDLVFRQNMRPGQDVLTYDIELTVNGNSFDGRAVLSVFLSLDTREDDIVLYIDSLDIHSAKVGVFSAENVVDVEFTVDGQELHISPHILAQYFFVVVEYSGQLANSGRGLYRGQYNEDTYVAMNLHPTYARRVFPCTDEPSARATMSFTFKNLQNYYSHLMTNSLLIDDHGPQFSPLIGTPHRWGMIAHNLVNVAIPITNVFLYGRPGVSFQNSVASRAIHFFYINLNEWTNKQFLGNTMNQNYRLNILALPDVSIDWHARSVVGIWEPYVFMEIVNSAKQRSIALTKIAEAMAKQWFGYMIYPLNWKYEWVVSGLASYAGWEVLRMFSFPGPETDMTTLDVNTLFVTEVIQESLLRDSYLTSGVLEPDEYLFNEDAIRNHIGVNGILKYKAPALMRMMRIVLGDAETDYIQLAGSKLLNQRSLEAIDSSHFKDALISVWKPNDMVDKLEEYLEPWIKHNGYPLLRVYRLRDVPAVVLLQENFGFSSKPANPAALPVTYTTSVECNFDKIYPVTMFGQSGNVVLIPLFDLDEEDWVLFNIQGQGYYRVTYDNGLWDNIIRTLEEPDKRELIHPLNRATLVDDALNIARAGKLDYDIAFRVVLAMEHETEYAPWKAFVRNMDFLRKRLVAYVDDDEDLDQDIYLEIIQRTIPAFEERIGFYPDTSISEPAMQTLTRGLVMDHACRANYKPCIAAAKEWFYDLNNPGVVNPNIPHDIRPAVYCTMIREGDRQVIDALKKRLEIEPTHYERLVILESLACSQDEVFINMLLDQTIAADSPYGVEERVKIFAAVAESSHANAGLARAFLTRRTSEIRNMYGGPEKLEQVIFILAENMVDADQSEQFQIWVKAHNNNLDDSQMTADRALRLILENLVWDTRYKKFVYEWINNMVGENLLEP